MNVIRKFAYAALLTLSALNFAPSQASAQDEGGKFTLSHEVHWQKAVVPAGKYRFAIETDGPSKLLSLRQLSGDGASFVILVNDIADSQSTDLSRLVIVSRASGSFVQQMQLPEFGMTLHFAVPSETREVAQAAATTAVAAAR
ncbi:MAG TPA: hypothetical protein VN911_08500 [Candidatus Acidoferrum sp.]|nr:hypothetical protein [Candidatus Acidoferrum sp.]